MVKDRLRNDTLKNDNISQNTDKSRLESPIAKPTPEKSNARDRAVRELALYTDQGIDAGLHLKRTRKSEPKVSKKRFPSKPCYYHHEMPGTSQDAIDKDAAIEHQLVVEESEELERQIAINQLKELESEEELERESKELLGEEDTEESMEIDYDLSTKEQESLLGQDTMEAGEQESIGTTPTSTPVKCQNNESTVTQKKMNQVMSNMKREIGAREKREIGARIARKMLPELCISKITDNSLNGNDTQGSDDPITVDLVNKEPEDKDRTEEVTPEKLMRFYDKTGKCYICDTSWSSETEVKKHLLYVQWLKKQTGQGVIYEVNGLS